MERDFFATAAQVVPVLALAGLLDGRRQSSDDGPAWVAPLVRLFLFAGLVVAEVAAFTALAGRPTEIERRYVIIGLVIGGVSLIERFGDAALDEVNETVAGRWVRLTIVVVWALVVFGAIFVPLVIAVW